MYLLTKSIPGTHHDGLIRLDENPAGWVVLAADLPHLHEGCIAEWSYQIFQAYFWRDIM
jgi:hypothetical protein